MSTLENNIARSASVERVFHDLTFGDPPSEGGIARLEDPSAGFSPFCLQNGTEVVFVRDPRALDHIMGIRESWQNALGAVIFRHVASGTVGMVALHGVMQTPWSLIGENAWQALGGIMAFSGVGFDQAARMVLDKAAAMTTKWRFIDQALAAIGHGLKTSLGGAKAILLHPEEKGAKEVSIGIAGQVINQIGAYISGPDQNMGPEPSRLLARISPRNFAGASTADSRLVGMENPSPYTAGGVFASLMMYVNQINPHAGHSVFVQGHGGVGQPLVESILREGLRVTGVVDAVVANLQNARLAATRHGATFPVFLDARATEHQFGAARRVREVEAARTANIPVVGSLLEAMQRSRQFTIFSPDAGPHPLTDEVAQFLINQKVNAVFGAANNVHGSYKIAQRLAEGGVFVPNDSYINQLGAASVLAVVLGMNGARFEQQMQAVAQGVAAQHQLFFQEGMAPQWAMDVLAGLEWNKLRREKRARGGMFDDSIEAVFDMSSLKDFSEQKRGQHHRTHPDDDPLPDDAASAE